MDDKEMQEKFLLVYLTVSQLAKCVILCYANSPEQTPTVMTECRNFIELCKPFNLAVRKKKLPANNKSLLLALDVIVGAQTCIENKKVFDDIAQFVVKTAADTVTDAIKILAVEIDHRSK